MKRKSLVVKSLHVGGLSTPALYRALKPFRPAFLWESSDNRERSTFFSFHQPGRFSYIGLAPASTHSIQNHTCSNVPRNHNYLTTNPLTVDPLEYAQLMLSEQFDNEVLRNAKLEMPFTGGLAGLVSFDAARYFEHIKGTTSHPLEQDFYFLLVDQLVVIDNLKESITVLIWHEDSPDSRLAAEQRSSEIEDRISQAELFIPLRSSITAPIPHALLGRDEFISMVERAKDYICAGDIFQVVLSNSFSLGFSPDPLSLYVALKSSNPSPYHHLFSFGDQCYVGASPEVMLRGVRRDNHDFVFMRPVAGTYPRHLDPKLDQDSARELAENEKELAEHVMLVDLERNDIGRVARSGTVQVTDLCSVETYSHVHHLVSQVSGILRPKEHIFSALRSCFPIGTLAGTPKIRAMEIIAELEAAPRGIFGGCCFLADPRGNFDSCVAIRGITIGQTSAVLKAGAGIVFDSDAEREYEECLWKCRAMRAALEQLGK